MVLAIPAIVLGWWLISPLFLDSEVNEAFPLSSSAVVPDDMTQEEVEAEMESAATAPDTTTDEAMPEEGSGPGGGLVKPTAPIEVADSRTPTTSTRDPGPPPSIPSKTGHVFCDSKTSK